MRGPAGPPANGPFLRRPSFAVLYRRGTPGYSWGYGEHCSAGLSPFRALFDPDPPRAPVLDSRCWTRPRPAELLNALVRLVTNHSATLFSTLADEMHSLAPRRSKPLLRGPPKIAVKISFKTRATFLVQEKRSKKIHCKGRVFEGFLGVHQDGPTRQPDLVDRISKKQPQNDWSRKRGKGTCSPHSTLFLCCKPHGNLERKQFGPPFKELANPTAKHGSF